MQNFANDKYVTEKLADYCNSLWTKYNPLPIIMILIAKCSTD